MPLLSPQLQEKGKSLQSYITVIKVAIYMLISDWERMPVKQRRQISQQEACFLLIYIQQESCTLMGLYSFSCLCLFSSPSLLCNCFKLNLIWDNQQKDEPGPSLRVSTVCTATSAYTALFYIVRTHVIYCNMYTTS